MKFFGFISASLIAAESSPVPFEFDDSEFYGSPQTVPVSTVDVTPSECCSTLKIWGDVALFSGRFDKSTEEHDMFPIYTSAAGDLKLFFDLKLNRWVVSNIIEDGADIRAFGESTSCPDSEKWMVWDGQSFDTPELVEPWSPYIAAPKLFECRPETFEILDLKSALSSELCNWIASSDPVHSSRYCREVEQTIQLVFADWDSATDNFLNSNMLMTANHLENLDQWHAAVNSIILKRTWDMEDKDISSLQSYLRHAVSTVRSAYPTESWAINDSRFFFLQS